MVVQKDQLGFGFTVCGERVKLVQNVRPGEAQFVCLYVIIMCILLFYTDEPTKSSTLLITVYIYTDLLAYPIEEPCRASGKKENYLSFLIKTSHRMSTKQWKNI